MSQVSPACAPGVVHPAAADDLCEEHSPCAVALGLQHVVESIVRNLSSRHRLRSAALVCQQWSTVAAQVAADEGIHMV